MIGEVTGQQAGIRIELQRAVHLDICDGAACLARLQGFVQSGIQARRRLDLDPADAPFGDLQACAIIGSILKAADIEPTAGFGCGKARATCYRIADDSIASCLIGERFLKDG